ncbi:MAG TPA: PQQ-dependent sugar dehydrogenase [Gemmatimonadales bacterium]|nr:PQQ-dependent sugar dehydrogenase [Gemmatimonadales bacterium]
MRKLLPLLSLLAACSGFIDNPPPPPPPPGSPSLHLVGNFTDPVYLTAAPGDTQRLFVVEQAGRVMVLHHDSIQSRPFLDLRGRISTGGERGLLSIAFDPLYASNGRAFVYFTDAGGNIRIVRYTVSSDPDSLDAATADTILTVAHPGQSNHNGGQLQFGPDGKLWAGTGDGGGTGDPGHNAQNKHALLGKLLRLDVSGASGYTMPADNPAATDTSFAPEVWAYGLRNPWRFTFDRQTGDLYIGDVGQDLWEEVDLAPTSVQRGPGANYGWSIMEGKHCYPSDPCTAVGIPPIVEYIHAFYACAIVGGYVYRGSAMPVIQGYYFYADNCNANVWGIKWPDVTQLDFSSLISPGSQISSFGQDAKGELYIMRQGGGEVYRIVPAP